MAGHCTPSSSLRKGGVHINLLGYNECVNRMLNVMKHVARRSHDMLLTDENKLAYRKVCAYIATVRVAAAQDEIGGVSGNPLELGISILYEDIRRAKVYCKVIPRFLAWCLSHIGIFEHSGRKNAPLLPHPVDAVTVEQAASGNVFALSRYITALAAQAIPEGDRPTVRIISEMMPQVKTTRDNRFTDSTVDFWQMAQPTREQWTIFNQINSACEAQRLCVTRFSFRPATGSAAQIIRFPSNLSLHEDIEYYCLSAETAQTECAALALRLGADRFLADDQRRDRFIGNPRTALMSGSGEPFTHVQEHIREHTREQ